MTALAVHGAGAVAAAPVLASFPWFAVAIGGGVLFAVGLVVFALDRDRCGEARQRVRARRRTVAAASAALDSAERSLLSRVEQRERAEDDLDRLAESHSPACFPETFVEDPASGARFTSTERWIERRWARHRWDRAGDLPGSERAELVREAWRVGPPPEFRRECLEELAAAGERKEALEALLDEAEDAEDDARRQVELARATADRAARDLAEAQVALDACVSGTPVERALVEGSPCRAGDRRVEVAERFDRDLIVDFSLRVSSMGHGRIAPVELMHQELGTLAHRIDSATRVPADLEALAGDVLGQVAGLGDAAAEAAAAWELVDDLYTIRFAISVRRVELWWGDEWTCRDARWARTRSMDGRLGRIRRAGRSVEADLTLEDVRSRVPLRARALQQRVERDLDALRGFLRTPARERRG